MLCISATGKIWYIVEGVTFFILSLLIYAISERIQMVNELHFFKTSELSTTSIDSHCTEVSKDQSPTVL